MNSKNIKDAISSQESECGTTHSDKQDGQMTLEFGQDHAPVKASPAPGKDGVSMTNGICGLPGLNSSKSDSLYLSLANRLLQKTRSLGSTLYAMTWKVRATPSGRLIYALRASALRTSGKDCSGWPSPNVMDTIDREKMRPSRAATGRKTGYLSEGIKDYASPKLTGWRTPNQSDGEGGVMEIRTETAGKYKLRDEAPLAGWVTPSTRDHKDSNGMSTTGINPDGSERTRLDMLPRQARLMDFGQEQVGYLVPTTRQGQLNAGLSRWLMSCPEVFDKYSPGFKEYQTWQNLMMNLSKEQSETGSEE